MSNISNTNSTYGSGGIDTQTTLDGTFDATFQQMNGAASAAIAIETVLGDGPTLKGNLTDLVSRLAILLNADGQLKTTGFIGLTTDYGLLASSATAMAIMNHTPIGSMTAYGGAAAPTNWLLCNGSAINRTTYAKLFTAISTTYGAGDGSTTFNLPDMRGRTLVGAGVGTTIDIPTTTSSNGFTVTSNTNKWITGMPVVWSALSGFTTSGSAGPTYYVVRVSSTNIRFATTLALAEAGTPDVTISGSGSCTVTYTMTSRALGEAGGEETHAISITELTAHTHQEQHNTTGGSGIAASGAAGSSSPTVTGDPLTQSTGGGAAHNNMQPWQSVNWIIFAGV